MISGLLTLSGLLVYGAALEPTIALSSHASPSFDGCRINWLKTSSGRASEHMFRLWTEYSFSSSWDPMSLSTEVFSLVDLCIALPTSAESFGSSREPKLARRSEVECQNLSTSSAKLRTIWRPSEEQMLSGCHWTPYIGLTRCETPMSVFLSGFSLSIVHAVATSSLGNAYTY
jgi:hypothetical protein